MKPALDLIQKGDNQGLDKGKASSSSTETPKPLIRACEGCRARKIRCLPYGNSDTNKCQRCTKSGRDCIFTVPEKRRRRKRTDTRVAELEHTVQVLAAKLEFEQQSRLDQTEQLRRQSDSSRLLLLDSMSSQHSDVQAPSSLTHEALRQDLLQNTNKLAALKSGDLRLIGPLSTYTPSSPGGYSTSERATDLLSLPDATPSPSSTLASSEAVPSNLIEYRAPTGHGTSIPTWAAASPYLGISPPPTYTNDHLYSTYPYSQGQALAFSLPSETQPWAAASVPHTTRALDSKPSAAQPTEAHQSYSLTHPSAPYQPSTPWYSGANSTYSTNPYVPTMTDNSSYLRVQQQYPHQQPPRRWS
ncbi:MAG: hypothetical protein Q9219_000683 [cf. Caloplaca sp. 3 TL-2023]